MIGAVYSRTCSIAHNLTLGVLRWGDERAICVFALLWWKFEGVGVCVCIWYWYSNVIISVYYTYLGSVFPYIGDFNFVVCEGGCNGVGVYVCISYLL